MDLLVCHLGRVEYREAAALQERLRERVIAGELPELMLLLEHPPVYTVGAPHRRRDLPFPDAFYRERGIDVVRTPRGGQLTYHGPGQLVGYPIMRVASVPEYILTMEKAIVAALADAGVEARTQARPQARRRVGGRAQDRLGRRAHLPRRLLARLRRQRRQRPRPVQLGRRLRAARGADDLAARRGRRRGPARASASAWRGASARRSGAASGSSPPRGSASRLPGMDVGLAIFLTGDGHPPRRARASAPRPRGYESLMLTEHTHIPVSRRDGRPRRRRARREVPPHPRPVRRARLRRRGDREARRSARASAW